MFKHCLIAVDGSESAQKAVVQGLALAKQLNARVLAVMVTEPWTMIPGKLPTPSVVKAYEKANAENANFVTSRVVDAAKAQGVACSVLHVRDKHPAEGIVEAASKNGCDLIVMGSHGRGGLGRVLLGSVAAEVLTSSKIAVLVCR